MWVKVAVWVMNPGPAADIAIRNMAPATAVVRFTSTRGVPDPAGPPAEGLPDAVGSGGPCDAVMAAPDRFGRGIPAVAGGESRAEALDHGTPAIVQQSAGGIH